MKRIFIVGGNGFARECYIHVMHNISCNPALVFGGFLGHGGYGHTVNYQTLQSQYLGEVADFHFDDTDFVIIGAAFPKIRERIYHDLKKQNVKFYTLISKHCEINEFVTYGEANIFVYYRPSPCVNIGNGNVFNGEVITGHDVEIGDFNFFSPRVQVLGNVKIGDGNTIGANAIILPHAKIGHKNTIAPLSAVYKGCKNNAYYAGNPALKIGDVEHGEG